MTEPVVDLLAAEWNALHELGAGLTETEWKTATDLPGWSVQDNLSHIIGTERTLMGESPPDVDVSGAAHVLNPIGVRNEQWITPRRERPGAAVLAEFADVTEQRLATLRSMSTDDFDRPGPTPIGEAPYREFMNIRVFDCWLHEQDMRRAVGKPGNTEGPIAEHCLGRVRSAMPVIVGKRAATPEGATVVIGPVALDVKDGRARLLDAPPAEPTATLAMDDEAFWCVSTGRWTADQAIAEGRLEVSGDPDLAARLLANLNFMF